jgi:heme exporter protein C
MSVTDRLIPVLLVLSAVMFAAAPFVIDTAPYESTMGLVQRVFYFHLPVAMTMRLSAIVCGIAGAVYLFKRNPTADRIAVAAAELAVVFGLLTLVTGPLWARKAWGVWWEWDARITSTFIMWMVFNAYLLLRRFGGAGSEVLAAAVGFFGMALVPFIYWSVDMWRTLHPAPQREEIEHEDDPDEAIGQEHQPRRRYLLLVEVARTRGDEAVLRGRLLGPGRQPAHQSDEGYRHHEPPRALHHVQSSTAR